MKYVSCISFLKAYENLKVKKNSLNSKTFILLDESVGSFFFNSQSISKFPSAPRGEYAALQVIFGLKND